MPQGRPRRPGTEAQRAAARRQQVRENVRAFRRRRAQRALPDPGNEAHEGDDASQVDLDAASSSQSSNSNPSNLHQQASRISPETIYGPGSSVVRLKLGPEYGTGAVAMFLDRTRQAYRQRSQEGLSIDSFRLEVCSSTWSDTLTLAARADGADMFEDALLACALTILSLQTEDRGMSLYAVQTQVQALRKLRSKIDIFVENPHAQDATILSATAILCSFSELLAIGCWEDFITHIQGAGAIIEQAGPSSLTTHAAREIFLGYRIYQAPLSFLTHKATFLARREWTEFPWRNIHVTDSEALHKLLDIAYQLPTHMQLYDTRSDPHPAEMIIAQLEQLKAIFLQLEAWQLMFIESVSEISETAGPGYHVKLESQPKIPSHLPASYFAFYCGVQVALCDLARKLAEELAKTDNSAQTLIQSAVQHACKWSKKTRQAIDYFKKDGSGRFPLCSLFCMFSFDVTWATLLDIRDKYDVDVAEDLDWCRPTANWIQSSGVPVFKMRDAS